MFPSKYGHKYSGVGKFWVELHSQPETYSHGPFETRAEAEAEAEQLLAEAGRDTATVGEGDEITVNVPDADDILERISEGVYEQCGETAADYLDHHTVSQERRNELTDAVEKAVADWLTKHDLWPRFFQVNEVGKVTRPTEAK